MEGAAVFERKEAEGNRRCWEGGMEGGEKRMG
jgi:hypothetical protein